MSGTIAPEGAPADDRSLVHRALFFDSEADFLSAALPFLREGLRADDAVIVISTPKKLDMVRDVLGDDASSVHFADTASWFQHPVRTIAAYQSTFKVMGSRRMRVVSEPTFWNDRTPQETVEWYRLESLVNQVFQRSGAQVICCYDRRTVPAEVLELACRTHPELLYSDGMRESDDYTSPEVFSDVCSQMAIPFPDTPYSAESLRVEATDLWAVRDFVAKQARSRGIGSGALYNLLVAVTEVTANAVRHGHPPVTVCIWQDGGDLVCDVIDSGHWRPAESLGFVPPKSASDKGFGLWGVRMLCDSSQFHAGPAGTVVRLRIRI